MATIKTLIKQELQKLNRFDLYKEITTVRSHSYSGGNSVYVNVIDMNPADVKILENVVNKFVYGDFNGQDDSYSYRQNQEKTELSFKYGFVNNAMSDKKKEEYKEILKNKYGITDDESAMRIRGQWLDQLIWKEFTKSY